MGLFQFRKFIQFLLPNGFTMDILNRVDNTHLFLYQVHHNNAIFNERAGQATPTNRVQLSKIMILELTTI